MSNVNMRVWALPNLAIAALLAASPAWAQESEAPADPNEIVVTASKRAENLQSVPISVSAIGGDALERARVTSVDDLVTKVANLQLTSIVGDNTPNLRAARRVDVRLQPQPVEPGRDLL